MALMVIAIFIVIFVAAAVAFGVDSRERLPDEHRWPVGGGAGE